MVIKAYYLVNFTIIKYGDSFIIYSTNCVLFYIEMIATGIWTDLVRTKKTLTLDDMLPPLHQVCYKHFYWLLCVSMYTINCHCLNLFVPHKNNKQLVSFLRCNDYLVEPMY